MPTTPKRQRRKAVTQNQIFQDMESIYRVPIAEPFYTQLERGHRTILVKVRLDRFAWMKPGDLVIFQNFDGCRKKQFIKMVEYNESYSNLERLIDHEDVGAILPNVSNKSYAYDVCREEIPIAREVDFGVVAIGFAERS